MRNEPGILCRFLLACFERDVSRRPTTSELKRFAWVRE
jgi:hypothetical protein